MELGDPIQRGLQMLKAKDRARERLPPRVIAQGSAIARSTTFNSNRVARSVIQLLRSHTSLPELSKNFPGQLSEPDEWKRQLATRIRTSAQLILPGVS